MMKEIEVAEQKETQCASSGLYGKPYIRPDYQVESILSFTQNNGANADDGDGLPGNS